MRKPKTKAFAKSRKLKFGIKGENGKQILLKYNSQNQIGLSRGELSIGKPDYKILYK